jgi:hypothetical protein
VLSCGGVSPHSQPVGASVLTVVMVAAVVAVLMITVMVVVLMVLFMTLVAFFPTFLVSLIAPFFPTLFSALVLLVALTLPGTDVVRVVFAGPYEVHLPVARVILAAMQAPRPGVLRRNMQIQRFGNDHMRRGLLNDDRPGIDQSRRWPTIEVYAAIDTRRNLSLNGH